MYLSPRLVIVGDDTNLTIIETDFVPPTAHGVNIIVANVVLVVLTAIWTSLRFWCRRLKGTGFFAEDWMHLGALVCFYGLIASSFSMVFLGGAGHHLGELQPQHIIRLSKATYSVQVLFAFSMGLVKMSILWMRGFAIAANVVMAFTIGWALMTILMGLLICHPVEMNWNPFTPGGKCGDQVAAFGAVGIIDMVNELAILTLPIPMVLQLRMPFRYKAALFCVFGAGVLTLVFAAVRLYTVMNVDFTDMSYSAVNTTTYSAVEPAIAIIVSCSPTLRPVFDRVFGRVLSTFSKSRSSEQAGTDEGKNRNDVTLVTFGRGNRKPSNKNKRKEIVTTKGFTVMMDDDDDSEGQQQQQLDTRIIRSDISREPRQSDGYPRSSGRNSAEAGSAKGILITNEGFGRPKQSV
ncbi:phosphoglycerate mutase-like protein [Apiospora arundinis]